MTGRTASSAPASEQDFPGVALQQEGVGDDQPLEHLDDVAVERGRAWRRRCRRGAGAASSLVVDDFVLGESAATGSRRRCEKNPITEPPGRSIRMICRASACAAAFGRKSKTSQQRMPSTLPSAWRKRVSSVPGSSSSVPARDVAVEIGEEILDEQLAPELLAEERTLEPMTGPRSSSTGVSGLRRESPRETSGRPWTARGHLRRARTASPEASGWPGRLPPQRRRSDSMRSSRRGNGEPKTATRWCASPGRPSARSRSSGLRRRRPCVCWPADAGAGFGSASARPWALLAGLARPLLHVDAAAEVCAFGNRDARRRDVAVDRAVVADVDLVATR